ncbi:MAG: hypothetical protein ACO3ST_01560 [Burkholderiaceae bacterium]
MKKQMKMKKYAEGGMSDDDEGYDAYTTSVTDDEGEVLYEKPTPKARKAAPKKAAPKKAAPKKSADYVSAARNKYMEARGYDEASKNKNLSSEDRRAMLGRYAQAMKDYDTLGRASKYAESKGMKKGGSVKSSASRRADGIASRGKTRGRMI